MKKINSVTVLIALILVIIFGPIVFKTIPAESPYVSFAQCLSDKGAQFYGAFWCPHCATQKAEFKGADDEIPYIECSTPSRDLSPTCLEEEIKSFPTWKYNNRVCPGFLGLEELSVLTGCELPEGERVRSYESLLDYVDVVAKRRRQNNEEVIASLIQEDVNIDNINVNQLITSVLESRCTYE